MNLLVVNWQDRQNPQGGGAEIHLHEIFGRLARRGHEVTLLVSGWEEGSSRDALDDLDVHRVGGRHTFNVAAPVYYRRELGIREFDAVIEDLNKVPLFSPLWSRSPVILLVHHLFGATAFREASAAVAAATWLLERPLRHVYRGVPVQAVSESTASDLVERGLERTDIRVIPNGVDLEFYSPDVEVERFEHPTLLYLGRLKRYKRVDLVIRTLAMLRDRGIDAELIIAGRGDDERRLRRLAAELELGDSLKLRGYVEDDEKRRLFRRAWVHLLTSPKEGWGITNIEAAACGTPTVASDSPGLRDSVRDGETGFLAPHGDVSLLAERVERILVDPALRQTLGRGARRFAEQFSWEAAADLTEHHLRSAVARSGIAA